MRSWCVARVLILLAALLMSVGCASTGSTGQRGDRTDGVRLTLQVERGSNSIVRYAVDRDGSVSYAGGAVAQREEWSWTGSLTDDEIAQFLGLIREHQWERGDLDRRGDVAGDVVVYRIDLWTPAVRDRYRHVGESDRIMPMRDFLESVTQRRNADFMSTLPQPSREDEASSSGDG